jgi:DNA-binding NtrC family response regulator
MRSTFASPPAAPLTGVTPVPQAPPQPSSNHTTGERPMPNLSGGATVEEDEGGSFLDDQEKTSGHVPIRDELEALERKRILDALAQCAGNQTKAAKMLGMSRRTLLNRLDSYAIARPRKAKE